MLEMIMVSICVKFFTKMELNPIYKLLRVVYEFYPVGMQSLHRYPGTKKIIFTFCDGVQKYSIKRKIKKG